MEVNLTDWLGDNSWAIWLSLAFLLGVAEIMSLDLVLIMLAVGALAGDRSGRGGGPVARGVPRGSRDRTGPRRVRIGGPRADDGIHGLVRPTRWCTRRPKLPRPGRAGAQRPAGQPRARRSQVRLECVVPAGCGAPHHQERHGCPHRPDRVGHEPRRTSGRPRGPARGLGAVDGHVARSRPAVRPGVGFSISIYVLCDAM